MATGKTPRDVATGAAATQSQRPALQPQPPATTGAGAIERPATVAEALRWGARVIGGGPYTHMDDQLARNEAEWLLGWVAGWNRTTLLVSLPDGISDEVWERFWEAIQRRVNGEPLQYITGEAAFFGRSFHVEPGCLIPRPETELLAEAAITYIRSGHAGWSHGGSGHAGTGHAGTDLADFAHLQRIAGAIQPTPIVRVADIGTGSGALAVTIALECPSARVWAVDLSVKALRIAGANATALGAAESVTFVQDDGIEWLASLTSATGVPDETVPSQRGVAPDEAVPSAIYVQNGLHILVSNPPYIPSEDIQALDADVRDHEPRLALDGGSDGLDFYRSLAALGQGVFAPGPAALFLEVGFGQAQDVKALFAATNADFVGWTFDVLRDLQGIERVVCGVRS